MYDLFIYYYTLQHKNEKKVLEHCKKKKKRALIKCILSSLANLAKLNHFKANHDIDREVVPETKLQANDSHKKAPAELSSAQTLIYYNICS